MGQRKRRMMSRIRLTTRASSTKLASLCVSDVLLWSTVYLACCNDQRRACYEPVQRNRTQHLSRLQLS